MTRLQQPQASSSAQPSEEARLSRRHFIRTAAMAAAACARPRRLLAQPARLPRKPNLIVFLPDEQRADTLACYGNSRVHAPHLNKLAGESMIFERAYVTHPICTPSRSTLMTGTWPHQNGCTHNDLALPAPWKCFPELLGRHAEGYRTAYLGKWHLGDEVFAQHGFQEWASIEDIYQYYYSPGRDPKAISDYSRYLVERGFKPDNARNGTFSRNYASRLPIEMSKPRFLEQRACDFIDRNREEPFILFVSFLEPHPPYFGPLNDEHAADDVTFEPSAEHHFDARMPLRYRLLQEAYATEIGATKDEYLRVKRNYLGLVSEIDQSIGQILGKAESHGLLDSTIVVHTSDHGDMMGAHRLFGKDVMFEQAARVPYLIRMPGQRRSGRVTHPVSHIDFVPTLVDLLGAPPHPQCAGRSRTGLLRGEAAPPENVFLQSSPHTHGVDVKTRKGTQLASAAQIATVAEESTRTILSPDGWKLSLRNHDASELYHLPSDPDEMINRIERPGDAPIRARLSRDLRTWQKHTRDPVVVA